MSTPAIASENRTRLLRKPAVLERVGLSDTTIWRLERAGKFPRSIRLSPGAVAWRECDIETWIADARYGASDVRRVRELVALLDLFDLQRCRTPTEADIDAGMLPYHAKTDRVVIDNWAWIARVAAELDRLVGLTASEIVALKPHADTEHAA